MSVNEHKKAYMARMDVGVVNLLTSVLTGRDIKRLVIL